MAAEENKAIVRRAYEEVMNTGDLDRAEEFITPDFVEHEAPPGTEGLQGIDVFKQFFSMLLGAFPDFRVDVEDMIAEGDKVVTRITWHGTHQSEFMGIPPTSNRIEVSAIDIFRLDSGKLAEHWGQTDNLGMMQQLGVVPPPEQTG